MKNKYSIKELESLVFGEEQATKQNKDKLFKLAKAQDNIDIIKKLRDKLQFKSAKVYLEKYYHIGINEAIRNRDLKSLKRLIENGTDVSHINLVELVKKKYSIEYFQILLKAKSNIYKTDNDGRTALVIAIMQNHTELVNMLLNNGANANDKAYSGETALQIASSLGNEDIVTSLLEYEADINSVTNDKLTPLLLAVWKNHLPVVKKLLANGADLNIVDIYGVTPLIRASCEGHLEIVKFLIDQGVDINQADNNGITALMEANDFGHTDIQVLLLEHGAELIFDELEDMKINLEPLTPLMVAVVKNDLDKIEELLEQKPNITIKVSDKNHPYYDKTAIEIAYIVKQIKLDKLINSGKVITYERDGKQKISGHPNDMGLLMTYDEVITMIEEYFFISPSDPNVKTKNNLEDITLLITATHQGDYDTVKDLLDLGADVNAAINDKWTPLLIASNYGDYKMTKLLIKNGAYINYKLNGGYNAIILASTLGSIQVVKLLINNGININQKQINGYNSLMMAIKSHHSDIARELILNGIDIDAFSWDEGENALLLAVLNDDIEIVKLLLEGGVKVNQLMQGYYTVLDLCTIQNKKEFTDLLIKNGAKRCNLSDINKKPMDLILNDDLIVEDMFNKVNSTITSSFVAKQFILEEVESASLVPEEDNPTAKAFVDNSGFSPSEYKGALGRSLPEVDGAIGGQQILNKWLMPYMFYKGVDDQSHKQMVVELRYKIIDLIMQKYSLGKYSNKILKLNIQNKKSIASIFIFNDHLIDDELYKYEQITNNKYYNQEFEKYIEIDNNKISIYTKTYDEIGHKTEYSIIGNKEVYEYEFEDYIIEIRKQHLEHNPKALVGLLKKFSEDNRLKYTNHPWSDQLAYEEFDNKLKDGWREIQNDLKVLSPTLYDYINEFLFEEDNESNVGFSSNEIKVKLKDGTKPDSIKELTKSIANFKQNIVIKNDENLTLLDLFDRIIEKLDIDLDIDLEGIENFTTKLFTDVRKLEDAIVIILKDIYRMESDASIKVIAGKNPDNKDLIDLKIIHIDSKYLSESIELLNTIGKTGNFTTIYNNLKSVCHWDIEVECSDGKKRIEYLFPLKDNDKPHLISIPDKIEGFTHILRFYK